MTPQKATKQPLNNAKETNVSLSTPSQGRVHSVPTQCTRSPNDESCDGPRESSKVLQSVRRESGWVYAFRGASSPVGMPNIGDTCWLNSVGASQIDVGATCRHLKSWSMQCTKGRPGTTRHWGRGSNVVNSQQKRRKMRGNWPSSSQSQHVISRGWLGRESANAPEKMPPARSTCFSLLRCLNIQRFLRMQLQLTWENTSREGGSTAPLWDL